MKVPLFDEVITVQGLLVHGLAGVEELGFNRGDRGTAFLPLLLLSNGLERLLKCLWIAAAQDHGWSEGPGQSHNITDLLARLRSRLIPSSDLPTDLECDLKCLESDYAQQLLAALTEFAQHGGRYAHLDAAQGRASAARTPDDCWWQVDPFTDDSDPDVRAYKTGEISALTDLRRRTRRKRVAEINRIIRTISRWFTPNVGGRTAWSVSYPLHGWALLSDEHLGRKIYAVEVQRLSADLYEFQSTEPFVLLSLDLCKYGQ